jgi:protein SCO1/2
MYQKWAPIVLVVLSVLIGVVINFSIDQEYEFNGVLYQDPEPAPEINLAGTKGEFSLADQRGKVVLVFFGYTSCPDICPSTLSDLKRLVSTFDDDSSRIQVVFVTVDPKRDSPEKLKEYLPLFNQDFIGLTGDVEELSSVWNAYGVIREIDDSSNSVAGYLVNHTSRLYLIDPEGRLLLTYGFGTEPDAIAQDIAHILEVYQD